MPTEDIKTTFRQVLHADPTSHVKTTADYDPALVTRHQGLAADREMSSQATEKLNNVTNFLDGSVTEMGKDFGRNFGHFYFPKHAGNTIEVPCLNEKGEFKMQRFDLVGAEKRLDFGDLDQVHYAPYIAFYIASSIEESMLPDLKEQDKGARRRNIASMTREDFLPKTKEYRFLAEKLVGQSQGHISPALQIIRNDMQYTNKEGIKKEFMNVIKDIAKSAIVYDEQSQSVSYHIHNLTYNANVMDPETGDTKFIVRRDDKTSEEELENNYTVAYQTKISQAVATGNNTVDCIATESKKYEIDISGEPGIDGKQHLSPLFSTTIVFDVTPTATFDAPEIRIQTYTKKITLKENLEQDQKPDIIYGPRTFEGRMEKGRKDVSKILQGDITPVTDLLPPKQRRMFTAVGGAAANLFRPKKKTVSVSKESTQNKNPTRPKNR